ncbi:hypothetical protein N7462_010011 [Penicillium macrosclerotiorum]|uniref:uncharacterized protein n=1 Tax=Penicillium macrosclerotiorum TaxID=303699 RepID=UPI0025487AB1|nr:uncharacterized protein N7462_010011 [Penicillium macrosclerotiorum]KAJ5668941.1 hypothetical protein N7462_010011 [Penicillium macrosclerotiorum]
MAALLPPKTRIEAITVRRLTAPIASPHARVVERFRALVPPVNLGDLRAQSGPAGIAQVIQNTHTTTGFVLFAEFNHGAWIRHFPPFTNPGNPGNTGNVPDAVQVGHGAHRFIFGNPLYAITMIQESVEAALHVPLDGGFFEQPDGTTKMVILLPEGLVAGPEEMAGNEALRLAARELEAKVFKLIEAISE